MTYLTRHFGKHNAWRWALASAGDSKLRRSINDGAMRDRVSSEHPDRKKVLTVSTAPAQLHDFGIENAHIDEERGPICGRVNTPPGK
jgi:hypothetical protein